jgi:CRP-like cAMP-binding protein
MTQVDLAVIECEDFVSAQDKASRKMSVEDKYQFLQEIPLFKAWEPFKLYKIAHELVQHEYDKGAVVVKRGEASSNLYFLLHGRVDIFYSLHKKTTITSIQKFGYFGESGLISAKLKTLNKVVEESYGMCMARTDMLVFPAEHVNLFDEGTFNILRSSFFAKNNWRKERAETIRQNRKMFRRMESLQHQRVAEQADDSHTRIRREPTASKYGEGEAAAVTRPSSPPPYVPSRAASPPPFLLPIPSHGEPRHTSTANSLGSTGSYFTSSLPNMSTNNVLALSGPCTPLTSRPSTASASGKHQGGLNKFGLTVNTHVLSGSRDSIMSGGRPFTVDADGLRSGRSALRCDEVSNDRFEFATASAVPNLHQLWELDDIPVIVDQDLNPMMALPTCKTPKQSERIITTITDICRPKSARLRANSATRRKDVGFSEAIYASSSQADYLLGKSKDPLLSRVHAVRNEMINQAVTGERDLHNGNLLPVHRLSLYSREQMERSCLDAGNLHGSARIPTAMNYGGFKFDSAVCLASADAVPRLLRERAEARIKLDAQLGGGLSISNGALSTRDLVNFGTKEGGISLKTPAQSAKKAPSSMGKLY